MWPDTQDVLLDFKFKILFTLLLSEAEVSSGLLPWLTSFKVSIVPGWQSGWWRSRNCGLLTLCLLPFILPYYLWSLFFLLIFSGPIYLISFLFLWFSFLFLEFSSFFFSFVFSSFIFLFLSSPPLHHFCSLYNTPLWLLFSSFSIYIRTPSPVRETINKKELSIFAIYTCRLGLRNLGMLGVWNDIKRFLLCSRTKPITVGASEQKVSWCGSSLKIIYPIKVFNQWRDLVLGNLGHALPIWAMQKI